MSALKLAPSKPHAIKIEDLEMGRAYADAIWEELKAFAEELGYSDERISEIECRSYDGFSPYSHNKGGLEAIAFTDQYMAHLEGTGFANADATLEKYAGYNVDYFIEHKGITKEEFEKQMYEDSNGEFQEEYDEFCRNDEDTVMFSLQMIMNSDTEMNIIMDVCCKDSPYHRQFDDRLDFNITFKSINGLKRELKKILKNKDVQMFSGNVEEAY